MKKLFITVNKITYELKFSFGSLKLFLEMQGEDKFSAIDKYLKVLMVDEDTEPTFDFFETLGDVILSGAEYAAQTELNVTAMDMTEAVMSDPEKAMEIIAAFIDTIPRENKDSLGKSKAKPKKKAIKK